MEPGNHTVDVKYPGDDKYAPGTDSTVIEVPKETDYSFTVSEEDGKIVVDVPDDATGYVTVNIDGKDYAAPIKDGKAVIDVPSDLEPGNHTVDVTYAGDGKYAPVNNSTIVEVPKETDYPFIVSKDDGKIVINVPDDATGDVTVTIDGENYTVPVEGGKAVVDVPSGLEPGNHTVNVTYAGDDRYAPVTDSIIIEVPKIVDYPVNITEDDGKLVIDVPDDATGDVTVTIDGKDYTAPIKDGKAVVDISDLEPGKHAVEVNYPGDDRYAPVTDSTVIDIPKEADYSFNVTQEDGKIVVDVPDDATGYVTVTIDGKDYIVPIKDGEAVMDVPSDLGSGEHTVDVTYAGDGKYAPVNNSTTVDVPNVDITYDDGKLVIDVPDDATGDVTVTIDGEEHTVPIEDGKAVVDVPSGLEPGNHTVDVKYPGDDKYAPGTDSTVIEVPKETDYSFTVSEEDGKIVVDVPDDATGYVTVNIDGKDYAAPIKDGKAVIDVPSDLEPGNHTVDVTYAGDGKYAPVNNSTIVEVPKETDYPFIVSKDDGKIVINVPDDATGDVTVTIDGENYTVPVEGGKAVVDVPSGLEPGNHTVNVTYAGDDRYAPVTDSIIIEVPKIVDYPVNITEDDGKLVIDVPDDATGDVTVTIDGKDYTAPIKDGKAVVDISDLEPGKHAVEVNYPGDDRYAPVSNATVIDIPKEADIELTLDVGGDIIVGEDKTITVTLNVDDATGNVIISVNGVNYSAPIRGNTATLTLSGLENNTYTVKAIYAGDDKYPANETDSASFDVNKLKNYIDINVITSKDTAVISLEMPEGVNGIVLVDVNDKGYYVNVTDGKGSLELTDLENGNYAVNARYNDGKWESVENTTEFEIDYNPEPTPITIISRNIVLGEDLTVLVVVDSEITDNVTITIDGKEYSSRVSGGIAEFTVSGLDVGSYMILAKYAGNEKYGANSTTAFVEVTKVTDYPSYITNEIKNLTVHLPEDAKGNVTLVIEGKTFTGEIVNGTVNIYDENLAPGYHNVTLIYDGDDKYAPRVADMQIYVENMAIINAPDVTKYFSGPERFYVYLVDLEGKGIANATISIIINGITYTRITNGSGVASLALNLNSGNYTVSAIFEGNDEFNSTGTVAIVEVLPTIYANDVFKVFRNGTQYYGLFLDSEGNPLIDTEVSFNIHGVFYTRTTNGSGVAKLNINLEEGKYILTAINPVTGEMRTNTVEVISRIVENHDLTKYYRNASQFTAKILGDDGNPVGAGEEVTFNINGVFYTRTTDENGYVMLNINLLPGSYIITTYYKDCAESNHIVVLPILSADNIDVSADTDFVFKAHLLDGQGNPYAGQTIEFTLDYGNTYSAVTDSNGDAKVTLNLQTGKHLIKSTYGTASVINTILAK